MGYDITLVIRLQPIYWVWVRGSDTEDVEPKVRGENGSGSDQVGLWARRAYTDIRILDTGYWVQDTR